MCLPNRCLAMNVYSVFTIPAFGRHVTVCRWIACGEPADVEPPCDAVTLTAPAWRHVPGEGGCGFGRRQRNATPWDRA
jgi:hypothetical protein